MKRFARTDSDAVRLRIMREGTDILLLRREIAALGNLYAPHKTRPQIGTMIDDAIRRGKRSDSVRGTKLYPNTDKKIPALKALTWLRQQLGINIEDLPSEDLPDLQSEDRPVRSYRSVDDRAVAQDGAWSQGLPENLGECKQIAMRQLARSIEQSLEQRKLVKRVHNLERERAALEEQVKKLKPKSKPRDKTTGKFKERTNA